MKPEKQLARAAIEWRRAQLKFEDAQSAYLCSFSLPSWPARQTRLRQRTAIRDGALAKVALLADVLIEQRAKERS